MKIAVLSDTRVPTLPTGGHGLGRMAWDIAAGLAKRGHEVTLFGGHGTQIPDGYSFLVVNHHDNEASRAADFSMRGFDAALDLSHGHDVSRLRPDFLVVNWIADTECDWQPPRAIVGNEWQQRQYPKARIVPLGVDVDSIPFRAEAERIALEWAYLAYAAKIHPLKGVDFALMVHERQRVPVRFVGEAFMNIKLPNWVKSLEGTEFYAFLGGALGLLSPCRMDAGGRVNLEAAACGTPVLCLDRTGTRCHVEHGVSGYLCKDANELVEAVQDLALLERTKAREWVRETHDLRLMIDGAEAALQAAADGECW